MALLVHLWKCARRMVHLHRCNTFMIWLQWDCGGTLLAIACVDQGHALLFALATCKTARLETGLKVMPIAGQLLPHG